MSAPRPSALPVDLQPVAASRGLGGWLRRLLGRAPVVRLCAPAQVALGNRLDVAWSIDGEGAGELLRISLALTGSEIARQRISARTGISIVTETATFACVQMAPDIRADIGGQVELDAHALPHGKASALVPRRAVHSVKGRTNEIAWAIVVEATFRSRPPLRDSFAITVVAGGE